MVSEEAFVLPPLERHFRRLSVEEEVTLVNERDKEQNEAVVVLLLLFFSVGVVRGVTDNARFDEPPVRFLTLAVPCVPVNV